MPGCSPGTAAAAWPGVAQAQRELRWPWKPFLCQLCIHIPAVPVCGSPQLSPWASYMWGREEPVWG